MRPRHLNLGLTRAEALAVVGIVIFVVMIVTMGGH